MQVAQQEGWLCGWLAVQAAVQVAVQAAHLTPGTQSWLMPHALRRARTHTCGGGQAGRQLVEGSVGQPARIGQPAAGVSMSTIQQNALIRRA